MESGCSLPPVVASLLWGNSVGSPRVSSSKILEELSPLGKPSEESLDGQQEKCLRLTEEAQQVYAAYLMVLAEKSPSLVHQVDYMWHRLPGASLLDSLWEYTKMDLLREKSGSQG